MFLHATRLKPIDEPFIQVIASRLQDPQARDKIRDRRQIRVFFNLCLNRNLPNLSFTRNRIWGSHACLMWPSERIQPRKLTHNCRSSQFGSFFCDLKNNLFYFHVASFRAGNSTYDAGKEVTRVGRHRGWRRRSLLSPDPAVLLKSTLWQRYSVLKIQKQSNNARWGSGCNYFSLLTPSPSRKV